MGSFQPELAGQRGWCERGWRCSGWWGWLGVGHDRLSAGGVLAGEDEQGAEQGGGLAGAIHTTPETKWWARRRRAHHTPTRVGGFRLG